MKKMVAAIILCGMLTLAGCKDDAKVISGDVLNITDSKQTESQQNNNVEGNQTEDQNQAVKGYAFSYQGTIVEIDAIAEPILTKLGEADSYFESPSCAFEGIDKLYTYQGFELDTYPMDGVDYVSAVILKDDAVATMEGVSIGDPESKITEVYGNDFTMSGSMYVFEKEARKLCFIVSDGSIAAIEYRSTVLDE